MEQRRAVFASVEADADFLSRILIQCGLDRFQRRHHRLTQRRAYREGRQKQAGALQEI